MNTINVLIIEDTPAESDALIQVLKENNYNISGVARIYADALQLFYNTPIDIVVIDVFLNGSPEGITFAETINIVPNASKPFVFLSSSRDRQIFERAKLTQPFSFLMKPFNELEILYALEMAIEKFYAQPNVFLSEDQDTVISKDYLFIKKRKTLNKIHVTDILYVEVEDRYCNIITADEKFVVQMSLSKIMEILNPQYFSRTHRNFLVNTTRITQITPQDNLVLLEGGYTILLSDKYKNILEKFLIVK